MSNDWLTVTFLTKLLEYFGGVFPTISREIKRYIPDNFHGVYYHLLVSEQAKKLLKRYEWVGF
ncbi:hypothetical protein [Candidatus Enterovibrio escicola]|uniref:hypothetical protein n=1 Tax=Candidatus Enterovibrio escicola TaxID=1927127 RepID=UPI001CC28DC2|nr:hypothetical protein [Candidatus Enterovibrio escacola]